MTQYLSPQSVAYLKGCHLRTVQNAIASGKLKPTVEIIGPSGTVSAVGISMKNAENWNPRKKAGRPPQNESE